jgi:hypothetical protein
MLQKINRNKILGILLIGLSISLLPYDLKVVILVIVLFIIFSFCLIELFTYQDKLLTSLNILEVNHDINMRCLKIPMINKNHLEGKDLFKGIYQTLISNTQFTHLGFQKIYNIKCNIS